MNTLEVHPAPPSPYDSLELTRDIIGSDNFQGVYALRVKGHSMIDALINDGDIVILRRVNTAENGDMVAVWIKSQECTTLKRYFLECDAWGNPTGRVKLQPENRDMEPMYVDATDCEIQGKVITVIRHV